MLDGLQWGVPRRGCLVIPFAPLARGTGRKTREQRDNWDRLVKALSNGDLLYARIARSRRGTRRVYAAQFTVDGIPPTGHPVVTAGIASVDFGPSMSAVVVRTEDTWQAGLVPIAPGVEAIDTELRRQQRRLDRQHRAGSPGCFRPDGTHKRKHCEWQPSRQARATKARIAELHRRAAATRETLHNTYANQAQARIAARRKAKRERDRAARSKGLVSAPPTAPAITTSGGDSEFTCQEKKSRP